MHHSVIPIFKSLFFITILFGCICCNKANHKVALKVGDISITQQEYDILKNKALRDKNISINSVQAKQVIKNWNKQFVGDLLILAEAYKHNYQNDAETEKKVIMMSDQVITQKNGLLYTKTVLDSIKVTDAMIKEAQELSKQIFNLQVIHFDSEDDILGKYDLRISAIKTHDDFLTLFNQIKEDSPQKAYTNQWNWLSSNLVEIRNDIINLSVGELSKPIKTKDGMILMYLSGKQKISSEYEKRHTTDYVGKVLNKIEELRYATIFDKTLYEKSKIKLSDESINLLMRQINGLKITSFEGLRLDELENKILITYQIDNKEININTREFVNYYNNLMVKKSISSKEDLIYYLKEIPWNEQALLLADQLGITKEVQYLTERRNFKNSIIVNNYITSEFKNELSVSENELIAEYENQKERFNEGEYFIVSQFSFKTANDAWLARKLIEDEVWINSPNILENTAGLITKKLHQKFKNDNTINTANKEIKLLKPKTCSIPLNINKEHIIIYKEGIEGISYTPFNKVKDILEDELFMQRFNMVKNKLIEDLNAKYRINGTIGTIISFLLLYPIGIYQ